MNGVIRSLTQAERPVAHPRRRSWCIVITKDDGGKIGT